MYEEAEEQHRFHFSDEASSPRLEVGVEFECSERQTGHANTPTDSSITFALTSLHTVKLLFQLNKGGGAALDNISSSEQKAGVEEEACRSEHELTCAHVFLCR